MLGAVREGEEPGLPDAPALERLEHGLQQPASDAAIPEAGMDGERAEEAERAPARCEHRPDDLAVDLGDPGALRRGAEPRADEVAVAERGARIGEAANRPERQPQHPVRSVDVVGAHGPDDGAHGSRAVPTSSDIGSGCSGRKAQQRRPRNPLEQMAVLERDVEVHACDACVLARDRVRTRSLAPADRVDERVVLVLRDEEDLPRLGQRRVHHQQRARRREREREHVLERPVELQALRRARGTRRGTPR